VIGTLDAVEESNHRCDGPHLQFMTHLQHVLIESEATPMRLMPCVPPTQTGLPLPSTRLQVFTAHGNAVAAAAAATEANLCSTLCLPKDLKVGDRVQARGHAACGLDTCINQDGVCMRCLWKVKGVRRCRSPHCGAKRTRQRV